MWAYQESWIYRHREIVPFFKVLEGEQQLSTMILDYSISQTTLEEVFLKVSHCMWPTVASCICVEWELKTPCMLYIMTLNGPIPGHLRGLGMRPLVWNKSTSMGTKQVHDTNFVSRVTACEYHFLQVTLNELFRDQTYQPILMRSGSYVASSPMSPLSPVTSPIKKTADSGSFWE